MKTGICRHCGYDIQQTLAPIGGDEGWRHIMRARQGVLSVNITYCIMPQARNGHNKAEPVDEGCLVVFAENFHR